MFLLLKDPAFAATAPAGCTAGLLYEGVKVSTHVASHTRNFPALQGTIDPITVGGGDVSACDRYVDI